MGSKAGRPRCSRSLPSVTDALPPHLQRALTATTARNSPRPARERVIYTHTQPCSWLNISSNPHRPSPRAGRAEEGSRQLPRPRSRSPTAVLALRSSGRGRYLGKPRHLSSQRGARLRRPGRASPPAPSRETRCHRGGAPRRDSEGAGSTPPGDGALWRLPQPPRLLTRARMLPRPSLKGRQPGG